MSSVADWITENIIGFGGFYGFSVGAEVSLLWMGFQWMMIFALPLLLLYNGEKGQGSRAFFYIFYPVHLILLFVIFKFF